MADTPNVEVEQLRSQLDGLRASDPGPQIDAAKQRVGETLSNVAASVSDTVGPPIREGLERVRGAVAGARRTAAEVEARRERFSQQVRGKPLLSLGAAVLAGYVIGRAVR